MKSELTLAFNEIAEHSKLDRKVILDALESALVTAYRKALNASAAQHVVAKIDPASGGVRVFAEKEVVEDVLEPNTEVALDAAREVDPDAKLGDMVTVESTPRDFGRIAAQAAKQVILQKLREAERESQYQEFIQREGDIVNGTVQAVTSQSITVGLGRSEAILPRNQTVPGERYYAHQKVRAFILEVRKTTRGPQIILSRSHKNMLRRLLEYEVPEIYNGAVEIKSIAREPGHRSKVAVAARQEGVDPVGACVGMRGVRIQSIVKELNDEKIDVIEWNPEPAAFIAKSLSPARVNAVYLDDDPIGGRTAMVVVPDDQLSLAIGREGQNARLAAKLTSWRIDIKSLSEAANEAARSLREDTADADLAEENAEMLTAAEAILARKAEGRPIAPEDYQLLAKLVEMRERRIAKGRQAERAARAEKAAAVRATIPAGAWLMPLAEAGLPENLAGLFSETQLKTAGDLLEQIGLDAQRLVAQVEGLSEADLEVLQQTLSGLTYPEPEPEPVAEAEGEAPAEAEAAVAAGAPAETPAADAVPAEAEAEVEAVAAEAGEPEPEAEAIEEFEGKDDTEDTDDDSGPKKKGKKKAKKANVEITFDEDLGIYVTRRKRKPGRADEFYGVEE